MRGRGRGCLSRKSQCDAVSLKLSDQFNKAESLICSYSAMILQKLVFGKQAEERGKEIWFPTTFQAFTSSDSPAPITHHLGSCLAEQRVGSQRSLAPRPRHKDQRRVKSSCKPSPEEAKSPVGLNCQACENKMGGTRSGAVEKYTI